MDCENEAEALLVLENLEKIFGYPEKLNMNHPNMVFEVKLILETITYLVRGIKPPKKPIFSSPIFLRIFLSLSSLKRHRKLFIGLWKKLEITKLVV